MVECKSCCTTRSSSYTLLDTKTKLGVRNGIAHYPINDKNKDIGSQSITLQNPDVSIEVIGDVPIRLNCIGSPKINKHNDIYTFCRNVTSYESMIFSI